MVDKEKIAIVPHGEDSTKEMPLTVAATTREW